MTTDNNPNLENEPEKFLNKVTRVLKSYTEVVVLLTTLLSTVGIVIPSAKDYFATKKDINNIQCHLDAQVSLIKLEKDIKNSSIELGELDTQIKVLESQQNIDDKKIDKARSNKADTEMENKKLSKKYEIYEQRTRTPDCLTITESIN